MRQLEVLIFSLILSVLGFEPGYAQPINLYLIPGTATDHRVFSYFEFDSNKVNAIVLNWPEYSDCSTMQEYALKFLMQIDTTKDFAIAGVSMGGMIAKEICQINQAEVLFLISSALHKREISPVLRLGRIFPVHKLLTDGMLRFITNRKRTFKAIVKPEDKALYKAMVMDCGAPFIRWQFNTIMKWKSDNLSANAVEIVRIHGTKDAVIPYKHLRTPVEHKMEGGTHKSVINRGKDISSIINARF